MRPKLRAFDLQPLGEGFWVRDPLNLSEGLVVSRLGLLLMSLMDGSMDLKDIRAEFFRRTGNLITEQELLEFVQDLDQALLLESDNFRRAFREAKEKVLAQGVRAMSHVGEVYPPQEDQCREFLQGEEKEKLNLLGLMVPHMDLRVARRTYWEGYGRVGTEKRLIVILGVSHYWHEMPFSVLPLDMQTPFGRLSTRRDLIEKLQSFYRFDLTHDLLSYSMEHSIEFASLYAKMLFPHAQALAMIVSYGDKELLRGLAQNLLRVLDDDIQSVLFISSVDLSHVGKKFGDARSFDPSFRDRTYLGLMEALQGEEAFNLLQKDGNYTRIDGQYVNLVFAHLLKLAGAREGQLFDYQQYYEESTDSIVSYATLGFRA
ncbi:MAG: AmmeMemoRadiSam system protein B [Aquificaceae bacterium]|nr:AmmeMemoRadiSam system protein B [Aquificaceae bacterium]MCX8060406.1 AmmeMemoRadiSam system protein B [Aquificaceae bacterium]MDW8097647.1 AmmeMemoRadiSam system protein B [Aquificaceae bacterium]